jgi:very-short-patch-repair endonuclease
MFAQLFVLVILLAAAKKIIEILKTPSRESISYSLKSKAPLTANELEMYHRLCRALPEKIILAQVAVSAIVTHAHGKGSYRVRNQFNRKVLDFVICEKTGALIAAVELDDKTHERMDRMRADASKDWVLRAAGIRLIRWHSRNKPTLRDIRKTVLGEESKEPT